MLTGRYKDGWAGARDSGRSLFRLQAVSFLIGHCISSKELAELLAALHFLLRVSP